MMGNEEDAMEAFQEVFIKVQLNMGKLRKVDSQTAWLYRVTTNTCLNLIRSRNKRKGETVFEVEDIKGADSIVSNVVYGQTLDEILKQVPVKFHDTFVYYFLDGMTQEEVADVSNRSRITVARQLKKIKEKLKGYEQEQNQSL